LAIGAFFLIVAEGNLDAPYRQLTIIPALAPFVALGALGIGIALADLRLSREAVRRIGLSSFCLAVGLVLMGIVTIRHDMAVGTKMRDASIPYDVGRWEFAGAISASTPSGSLLVTAGEYTKHKGGNDLSPVLYYYADRQGWTLQPGEFSLGRVEELVGRGATHLAVEPRAFGDGVAPLVAGARDEYELLFESGEFLLFDLRSPAD
jgi:hypothetical protein